MQPEARFIARIHKKLDKAVHREKMHNPYRRGTADCWYSGKCGDLWIEYKWLSEPRKRGVLVPNSLLEPLQEQWIVERGAEGRNVWLAVGSPAGVGMFLPSELREKYIVSILNDHLLTEEQFAELIADHCLKALNF